MEVQNLLSISVLYLPLTILARIVLFALSKQLPAELVHIGWGCWRDDLKGSKWWRDDRSGELHSAARRCCQYSVTFSFTNFLNLDFGTGSSSSSSGWGSLYCMQRSLIWWNHEEEECGRQVRTNLACLWSGSSCRWHIMESNDNWRRWSMASPGRDPARKKIMECGVPILLLLLLQRASLF